MVGKSAKADFHVRDARLRRAPHHEGREGTNEMARIGFIGLGNMGLPMAQNLLASGHAVTGFDVVKASVGRLSAANGAAATSVAGACAGAEVVITMLPAGEHVRAVYTEQQGVLASVAPGTLLIDSSTIDVASARAVAGAAQQKGL